MKHYIETLGDIISRNVSQSPQRSRKLLNLAYASVGWYNRSNRGTDVRAAYTRFNGHISKVMATAMRDPKSIAMANILFPCQIMYALGIQPMFPEALSAYLACTSATDAFAQAAEDCNVPDSFCSYHKIMLGAGLSGVLGAPSFIANTTLLCDANQVSFRRLAQEYDVPHFVIDVPYLQDQDAVDYVAEQLRAASAQMAQVAGKKLDDDALRTIMQCARETQRLLTNFRSRRRYSSLRTTMTGELCTMMAPHAFLGSSETLAFITELNRAQEEAIAARAGWKSQDEASGVVSFERKRIFWVHTMPNWQNSMLDLFENGRVEMVGGDFAADCPCDIDPDHPYESMARGLVYSAFNGPGSNRVDLALAAAREAQADGIVVFCHWGCKQTLGLSQTMRQTFEAAGYPTLILDGDGCYAANAADGQMVTRVSAFIEQLYAQDGGIVA